MQFCRLQDSYQFVRARKGGLSVDAFYSQNIRQYGKRQLIGNNWRQAADFQLDLWAEWNWWKRERPYYNVWPAIINSLTGFDVGSIPFRSFLSAPDPHIAVCFQQGRADGIMCILVSLMPAQEGRFPNHHLLTITEQTLPKDMLSKECPTMTTVLSIPVGDEAKTLNNCPAFGKPETSQMLNVGIAVLLMERTAELFAPVILAKDKYKYANADESGKRRIEERAVRRRGQRGYDLGLSLEMMPHYRRPHPALYWTGKGGSIAKIIFREGSVVKRKVMTRVPTGRLGGELELVEAD